MKPSGFAMQLAEVAIEMPYQIQSKYTPMEPTIHTILPSVVTQEVLLHLIRKELQGRKFVCELSKIGFDAAIFNTDLGSTILSLMGHPYPSDTFLNWYDQTLDHFTNCINLHHPATAPEAAFNFYLALTKKLRELRPTKPTY